MYEIVSNLVSLSNLKFELAGLEIFANLSYLSSLRHFYETKKGVNEVYALFVYAPKHLRPNPTTTSGVWCGSTLSKLAACLIVSVTLI